ncbi:DUF4399 domain-containing protein [Halomicrobium salinisoli]|uniref:DUF4399 domain-containing protein n=1 Tax=Halomicrobium salinisoli TaxID=2878391 RepID=UPI001CF08605|nr:DUF4399 domain-containing protein [Halomicrobium salinisoli]
MSDERISRRAFAGAIACATTTGLAGCSGGGPSSGTATEGTETTANGTDTATESSGTATEAAATDTEAVTDADETTEPEETESEATETDDAATEANDYRNGADSDASVSFAVPEDGADLTSTSVQWDASAEGVTIEEAGEVSEGAGHYHLVVDADPVTPGKTVPTDDAHVHYGSGQTDGVLELAPGEHTLHLQVGDGEHVAMDLVDTVEVTVADEATLDLETSVDGSVVEWAVTAENYTVRPADEGVASDAGHLHAVVDADPVPVGDVVPADARHVHFNDGSASGSLDLAEQLGDEYEAGEHEIHFQIATGRERATALRASATVETE